MIWLIALFGIGLVLLMISASKKARPTRRLEAAKDNLSERLYQYSTEAFPTHSAELKPYSFVDFSHRFLSDAEQHVRRGSDPDRALEEMMENHWANYDALLPSFLQGDIDEVVEREWWKIFRAAMHESLK